MLHTWGVVHAIYLAIYILQVENWVCAIHAQIPAIQLLRARSQNNSRGRHRGPKTHVHHRRWPLLRDKKVPFKTGHTREQRITGNNFWRAADDNTKQYRFHSRIAATRYPRLRIPKRHGANFPIAHRGQGAVPTADSERPLRYKSQLCRRIDQG